MKPGPKRQHDIDLVKVRQLYLEGGMSFERVALLLPGGPSASTIRSRYLEAGGELRTTRARPVRVAGASRIVT